MVRPQLVAVLDHARDREGRVSSRVAVAQSPALQRIADAAGGDRPRRFAAPAPTARASMP